MKRVNIIIYQHSAGDFKVSWKNAAWEGEERSFAFDLGGTICFALGLKVGALTDREETEIHLDLKNPLENRGFYEGYFRGRGDIPANSLDLAYNSKVRLIFCQLFFFISRI